MVNHRGRHVCGIQGDTLREVLRQEGTGRGDSVAADLQQRHRGWGGEVSGSR